MMYINPDFRRGVATGLILLAACWPQPANHWQVSCPLPNAGGPAVAATQPAAPAATAPASAATFYECQVARRGELLVTLVARPSPEADPAGRWIGLVQLDTAPWLGRPARVERPAVVTDLTTGQARSSVRGRGPLPHHEAIAIDVDSAIRGVPCAMRAAVLWLLCADWDWPFAGSIRLYREPRVATRDDFVHALLGTADVDHAALLLDADPNGDGLCDADDIQTWVNRQGSMNSGQGPATVPAPVVSPASSR